MAVSAAPPPLPNHMACLWSRTPPPHRWSQEPTRYFALHHRLLPIRSSLRWKRTFVTLLEAFCNKCALPTTCSKPILRRLACSVPRTAWMRYLLDDDACFNPGRPVPMAVPHGWLHALHACRTCRHHLSLKVALLGIWRNAIYSRAFFQERPAC